ncbi:RNB domain-containing ribonuclease, partial [Zhongshania sp.]
NLGERPDAAVIQTMMLRSLSQAVYHPENEGHFGLHYAGYTHFTSPIRRYPDLLVHRALRYLVRSGGGEAPACFHKIGDAPNLDRKKIYPYDMDALIAQGANSSVAERRADEASRDVMAFLKCEFLQDHVGSEHEGIITAVTGFGMFVELQDLYIEGLVHITALPQDFYQFDQAHQRLIGERTRRVFQLGDAIKVQVLAVNLDQRKIDLGVVAGDDLGKKAAHDPTKPAGDGPKRQRRKPGQSRGRKVEPKTASPSPRRSKPEASSPAAKSAPRKKRQSVVPVVADVPAAAPKKTSVREALAKGLKGLMPTKSKAAAKPKAAFKSVGAKAAEAKAAEAKPKPRRSRSGAKASGPNETPKKTGGKPKSGANRTRRSR